MPAVTPSEMTVLRTSPATRGTVQRDSERWAAAGARGAGEHEEGKEGQALHVPATGAGPTGCAS
jgi:hypothetical protein